jgi:uncharacterized protein
MNQILDNYTFDTIEEKTAARKFFSKVYAFMFGALLISALIAFQYGNIAFISTYFIEIGVKGVAMKPLFYVVVFAPVGVAMLMQFMIDRLSFATLFALFVLYSVLIGFMLTVVVFTYTSESLLITFGVTAGTFGIMAIMGYITKADLTKFGSILMMAFWGIFLASIVNFFLNSDGLSYLISIIGVLVFTGLTAYHMQRLKAFAHDSQISEENKNKLALLGGFTLYVLFINLFLSLLRLIGNRD